MKKIILLTVLSLYAIILQAQPADLFEQGNAAYKRADYQQAVEAYSAILDGGYENATVYYNLGNAYYRLDEYGMAILNYERALRINPRYAEARQNLQLANSRTPDQITPLPEFFLAKWWKALLGLFSPTGWRVVFLVLLTLTAVAVVVFAWSSAYGRRKWALVCAVLLGVFTLLTLLCSILSSAQYNRHDRAVVTKPMVVVKSSPDANSIDKLVLHEGVVVTIDDSLDQWHKIRLADGNIGWLDATELTVI